MMSYRYKVFSDSKFEIVGKDEVQVATVERGEDNLWHIIPSASWVRHDGFNFGPFDTSDEAFDELGASAADQS
jgi:hypothetical protein